MISCKSHGTVCTNVLSLARLQDGYQFTVAATRTYWLHWDLPYRVDASNFTLHKMDTLTAAGWVELQARYVQTIDSAPILHSPGQRS